MPGEESVQARMLVSRSRGKYVAIDGTRVSRGRFFTTADVWLRPQIEDFVRRSSCSVAFDPFAGQGHLLKAMEKLGLQTSGRDLDPACGWPANDSLRSIPHVPDALIVTNPPYLAKHSARRKGVLPLVSDYYRDGGRYDLYEVALDQCLGSHGHVIALIPETFLNGAYPRDRLVSVTVLEERPFADTDCPVCVACFGPGRTDPGGVVVYRNDEPLLTLAALEAARAVPRGTIEVRFNVRDGRIGLRAVDLPDPGKPIAFLPRASLGYDPGRIQVSSRLVTYLDVPRVDDASIPRVISAANDGLARLRSRSFDLVLSPFKGNDKHGRRRRRLDYTTARALLEDAVRTAS